MTKLSLLIFFSFGLQFAIAQAKSYEKFSITELRSNHREKAKPWYPFLEDSKMLLGLYSLAPGQPDRQPPHEFDEVYVVMEGRAVLVVESDSMRVEAGSVVYVRATLKHAFHRIEEPLSVLVFFSKGTPRASDQNWKTIVTHGVDQVRFVDVATLYGTFLGTPGTAQRSTSGDEALVAVLDGTGNIVVDGVAIPCRARELVAITHAQTWAWEKTSKDARVLILSTKSVAK